MKIEIAIAIAALTFASQALAQEFPGWRNLRWGATLDEVRKEYPALEAVNQENGSFGYWALKGFDGVSGEFRPGGKWEIEFEFSKSGALHSVVYALRTGTTLDASKATDLRAKVAAIYGAPVLDDRQDDSRTTVWRSLRASIMLTWLVFPDRRRFIWLRFEDPAKAVL